MNELFQIAKRFNDDHAHRYVFAHIDYSGVTQCVDVRVDKTESRYQDPEDVERLYRQHCYLYQSYGTQKDLDALTQHFKQWVSDFEKQLSE